VSWLRRLEKTVYSLPPSLPCLFLGTPVRFGEAHNFGTPPPGPGALLVFWGGRLAAAGALLFFVGPGSVIIVRTTTQPSRRPGCHLSHRQIRPEITMNDYKGRCLRFQNPPPRLASTNKKHSSGRSLPFKNSVNGSLGLATTNRVLRFRHPSLPILSEKNVW